MNRIQVEQVLDEFDLKLLQIIEDRQYRSVNELYSKELKGPYFAKLRSVKSQLEDKGEKMDKLPHVSTVRIRLKKLSGRWVSKREFFSLTDEASEVLLHFRLLDLDQGNPEPQGRSWTWAKKDRRTYLIVFKNGVSLTFSGTAAMGGIIPERHGPIQSGSTTRT